MSMKRGHRGAAKDYSDAFLVAILIGIVVIVLSLMVAIAHSTSRYPEISAAVVRMDQRGAFRSRDEVRGWSSGDPVLGMINFFY
ncbi:hypothetical protein V1291_002184 [Nitrobacteraceae bacterium AZCC 1564]